MVLKYSNLTRMKKKILPILLGTFVFVAAYAIYLYNKPHRNIHQEQAAFTGTAQELMNKMLTEKELFANSILNHPVELEVKVLEKENSSFICESNLLCHLDSTVAIEEIALGKLYIKGRVVGVQDDILYGEMIVLDNVKPKP